MRLTSLWGRLHLVGRPVDLQNAVPLLHTLLVLILVARDDSRLKYY